MITRTAEQEYFRNYDSSNGVTYRFDDPTPVYRDLHESVDELNKLETNFRQEIETNLITLSSSKPNSKKYLQTVSERLNKMRDDLYHHRTILYKSNSKKDDEFTGNNGILIFLYKHHLLTISNLLDFIFVETEKLNQESVKKRGRKKSESGKIPWARGTARLGMLFEALRFTSKTYKDSIIFIDEITISDFESHFLKGTKEPLQKIDWIKDKYLLVHLFDLLLSEDFFESHFNKGMDIAISEHFTFKRKPITPEQIYSARDTFKNKKRGKTGKTQKKILAQVRLKEAVIGIKKQKAQEDFPSVLTSYSAKTRT